MRQRHCFGVAAVFCLGCGAATAQPFTITIDPPGTQTSSVANGIVETFDTLTPGTQTNIPFNSAGSYNQGIISRADVFGGAGRTGNFLTATTAGSTLSLNAPQRYFGMWWSAGDPNDVLQFYSGTKLLQSFTTKDVIDYINSLPAAQRARYSGNPNFNGANAGEPYAFINFFADPGNAATTFDKIIFSGPGFETDNHTIIASYTVVVGMEVDPEPIAPVPGDIIEVGNGGQITSNTPAQIGNGSEVIVDPGGSVVDSAPVVINPGGTVAGSGTVTAPIVENNGTLVSDGMTVEGTYKQDPNGILTVPAQNDALKVQGKAMLGGALIVSVPPVTGSVVQVVTATNGVTGNFATAADPLNSKGLGIAVIYTNNGVEAAFLRPDNGAVFEINEPQLSLGSSDLLVTALAPTANLEVLPLQVGLSELQLIRRLIRGCLSTDDGVCVTSYSEAVNQTARFANAGIAVGINHQWRENVVAGFTAGYNHSWGDAITVDTGWGALEAAYLTDRLHLSGAVYAGGSSFAVTRPALAGNAVSGASSYLFGSFIETGYSFPVGAATIGPFASLQYGVTGHGGYGETSGPAPLVIHGASQYSLASDIGVEAGWSGLHLRLGWQHEYAYSAIPTGVSLIDTPGTATCVYSPRFGRDSLLVQAGVEFRLGQSLSANLSYWGQFGGNATTNGGFGTLKYSF